MRRGAGLLVGSLSMCMLIAPMATPVTAAGVPMAKKYGSCASLLKAYPNGVAKSGPVAADAGRYDWKVPKVDAGVFSDNSRTLNEYEGFGVLCPQVVDTAAKFNGYVPPEILGTRGSCVALPPSSPTAIPQWWQTLEIQTSGGSRWKPRFGRMNGDKVVERNLIASLYGGGVSLGVLDSKGRAHSVPFPSSMRIFLDFKRLCPNPNQ